MIRHVAGIAEVVDDIEAAVRFYRDDLGLEVNHEPGEGYATVAISGVAHFGIWLRSKAAELTFGDSSQIDRIPLGFSVGFEVDSVEAAENSLRPTKTPIVQGLKVEPWGQQTARFLSPSGALCELSETPGARETQTDIEFRTDA